MLPSGNVKARYHGGRFQARSSSGHLSPVSEVCAVFSNGDLPLTPRGGQGKQQKLVMFLESLGEPRPETQRGASCACCWGFCESVGPSIEWCIISPDGIFVSKHFLYIYSQPYMCYTKFCRVDNNMMHYNLLKHPYHCLSFPSPQLKFPHFPFPPQITCSLLFSFLLLPRPRP